MKAQALRITSTYEGREKARSMAGFPEVPDAQASTAAKACAVASTLRLLSPATHMRPERRM